MGWNTISDAMIDADSPPNETLFAAMRDNMVYNHDRAVRSGTHASGVRTAMARGRTAFEKTLISGDVATTIAIVFATDAADGDPNFSATPVVTWRFEEDVPTPAEDADWDADGVVIESHIQDGLVDADGFTLYVDITSSSADSSIHGYLHWMAIGAVTSGE